MPDADASSDQGARDPAREELEQAIRIRCERRDWTDAATGALRGYGPQVFGLLMALHRKEQDAADVFSMFTEDVWVGLEGFAWACTFRTWAYTLARNASHRFKERLIELGKQQGLFAEGSNGG